MTAPARQRATARPTRQKTATNPGASGLYAVEGCRATRCGASIRWVDSYAGHPIPLDHGRDPAGSIVLDHDPTSDRWTARALVAGDDPTRPRYTVHWATCHVPDLYAAVRRKADPDGTLPGLARHAVTSGPCARCGAQHPNLYGDGASPLCPPCDAAARARWSPAFRAIMGMGD